MLGCHHFSGTLTRSLLSIFFSFVAPEFSLMLLTMFFSYCLAACLVIFRIFFLDPLYSGIINCFLITIFLLGMQSMKAFTYFLMKVPPCLLRSYMFEFIFPIIVYLLPQSGVIPFIIDIMLICVRWV